MIYWRHKYNGTGYLKVVIKGRTGMAKVTTEADSTYSMPFENIEPVPEDERNL